ncbi:MAG: GDP-mannose 4,6-dehydratase [Chloroflexota bacterium]
MRVLITGIAGFVGRHLAAHLAASGNDEIWGIVREAGGESPLIPSARLVTADLQNRAQVDAAVQVANPDVVYHLAAQSSVARSLTDPLPTLTNNLVGQVNLFESLLAAGLTTRVLVVGSNEEYGLTRPDELPIRETKELRPISPYAVSKVAQDMLAHQYFATRKLDVVRVRPFVHTGPGQSDTFVTPSFARQLVAIERGEQDPVIRVGYLKGERDFCDVRDVVRGYKSLVLKGVSGEVYNLGSGKPRSIESLLHKLIELSSVNPTIEVDPARVRPLEVPVQYADCSKLRAATGWEPTIPFEQTLADVLTEWRTRADSQPTLR